MTSSTHTPSSQQTQCTLMLIWYWYSKAIVITTTDFFSLTKGHICMHICVHGWYTLNRWSFFQISTLCGLFNGKSPWELTQKLLWSRSHHLLCLIFTILRINAIMYYTDCFNFSPSDPSSCNSSLILWVSIHFENHFGLISLHQFWELINEEDNTKYDDKS